MRCRRTLFMLPVVAACCLFLSQPAQAQYLNTYSSVYYDAGCDCVVGTAETDVDDNFYYGPYVDATLSGPAGSACGSDIHNDGQSFAAVELVLENVSDYGDGNYEINAEHGEIVIARPYIDFDNLYNYWDIYNFAYWYGFGEIDPDFFAA